MFSSARNLQLLSCGGIAVNYTNPAPFVSIAQKKFFEETNLVFELITERHGMGSSGALRDFIQKESTVWSTLETMSETLAMVKSNKELPNLMVKMLGEVFASKREERNSCIIKALEECLVLRRQNEFSLCGANPMQDENSRKKQYDEYMCALHTCIYYLFASHTFVCETLSSLSMKEPQIDALVNLPHPLEYNALFEALQVLFYNNGGKYPVPNINFVGDIAKANCDMELGVWPDTKIVHGRFQFGYSF
jgi:hypothetical protein